MGTTYNIKYFPSEISMKSELLQHDIDQLLDEINSIMSTYDTESELSQLNLKQSDQCIPVSNSLLYVLEKALTISELSQGSFDITVGPLVNLWGFGPNGIPIKIPTDEAITEAKTKVGYANINLDKDNSCLVKNNSEITIDLSAIAKGYAVDKVAALLEALKINRYMVEIGGEVNARGLNVNQVPWQIGIEKPVAGNRSIHKVIALDDKSMASSGDYRNYFEFEGQQYSHLIDANTGKPIRHELVSVTVLHDSCMMADALATAFIVMGYNKAKELAESENIAVLFILKDNNDYIESTTKNFPKTTIH